MSKDADWFSRTGRVFIRNVSIETPPLSPDKPVTPDELVAAGRRLSRNGRRRALAQPRWQTARQAVRLPRRPGRWRSVIPNATSCAGIGAPDNVNFSSNARGDRVAVVSYSRGQRARIYTFTAGRLTSIERAPEAGGAAKGAKPKKKPAA
jgi:hypothetical protein